MKIAAIIPAAGKSRRFGPGIAKLFLKVEGKPVLFYTLKNLCGAFPFQEIFIASDAAHFKAIEKIMRLLNLRNARLVQGGSTRAESVKNALLRVSPEIDWVLVHDAARPLVNREIVRSTIAMAQKTGGAISAIPATATVKRLDSRGFIQKTENRQRLYLAQTPQVFFKEKLISCYKKLKARASAFTDEAAFFDNTDTKVRVAPGALSNLKITTAEDLELFHFYLKQRRKKRG